MTNTEAPHDPDNRPAVGGPDRQVRPAVAVAHGSDEHLTLLGAPYHWNLLTGVDRADMLAFGRACMDAESERWIAKAGAAYTDAHDIFNDPPGETPQEVRDVIEWHLSTMRA